MRARIRAREITKSGLFQKGCAIRFILRITENSMPKQPGKPKIGEIPLHIRLSPRWKDDPNLCSLLPKDLNLPIQLLYENPY